VLNLNLSGFVIIKGSRSSFSIGQYMVGGFFQINNKAHTVQGLQTTALSQASSKFSGMTYDVAWVAIKGRRYCHFHKALLSSDESLHSAF
jgi:hypothetical protein